MRLAARHRPNVLDLFCGAGGLSVGFRDAGYRIVGGVDSSPVALETFHRNVRGAKPIAADLRRLEVSALRDAIGRNVDVLVGGPSCQGFSTSGGLTRGDGRQMHDPRNHLFQHYLRIVEGLRPSWIVFENVPGLLLYHHGEVARTIAGCFNDLGYTIEPMILLAADYGVPQLRRRLFFVGNRTGSAIQFPVPTHGDPDLWANFALPFTFLSRLGHKGARSPKPHVSFSDAVSDLPAIDEGDSVDNVSYRRVRPTAYQQKMRRRSTSVRQHISFELAEFDRLAANMLRPGENWRDIPEHLRPPRFQRIRPYDATTLMRRLVGDRPSYTVTTKFNEASTGAFIHPSQDRTLSIREAARLQSFTDDFVFAGSPKQIREQIGNAVPPLLARAVAEAILPLVVHDLFDVDYPSKRKTLRIEDEGFNDRIRLHKARRRIRTYESHDGNSLRVVEL